MKKSDKERLKKVSSEWHKLKAQINAKGDHKRKFTAG